MTNALTTIPETTRALVYRVMLMLTIIAICIALITGVEQSELIALITAAATLIPQILAVLNTTMKPSGPAVGGLEDGLHR